MNNARIPTFVPLTGLSHTNAGSERSFDSTSSSPTCTAKFLTASERNFTRAFLNRASSGVTSVLFTFGGSPANAADMINTTAAIAAIDFKPIHSQWDQR